MEHFDHGNAFVCAVCVLEKTMDIDLERIQQTVTTEMSILTSDPNVSSQPSTELKESFERRSLEDTELVLLLIAQAYSDQFQNTTAETVYLFYYTLAKRLQLRAFKRFKSSNSYQSLRRRLSNLRSTYGGGEVVLQVVCKHPVAKVACRAATLLNTIKAMHEEPISEATAALMRLQQKRISERRRRKKRRVESKSGTVLSQQSERDATSKETPKSALPLVEYLDSMDEYVGFSLHHQQRYFTQGFDLDSALLTALQDWIPLLDHRRPSSTNGLAILNKLKSLFFIALGCGRIREAGKILSVVIRNIRKTDPDYWRFFSFQLFVEESTHRVSFDGDLYQRMVAHISPLERQIYMSLRFELLVKYSRFTIAKGVAKGFVLPDFSEDLAAWVRLLQCSLTLPLVFDEKFSVEKILSEALTQLASKVQGQAFIPKGGGIAKLVAYLFTNVTKFFPVHLPFLGDLGALCIVVVTVFESEVAAKQVQEHMDDLGLCLTAERVTAEIFHFAKLSFEAGTLSVTSSLLEALHKRKDYLIEWELHLFTGQVKTMLGDHQEAEVLLIRATQGAESSLGTSNSYARCLVYQANAKALQGHYHGASVMYDEAKRIFKVHRNSLGVFKAAYLTAALLRKSMALEMSTKVLEEVLPFQEEVIGKDSRFEALLVFSSLATNFHLQGRRSLSNKWHRKGLQYVTEHKGTEVHPGTKIFLSCSTIEEWIQYLKNTAGLDFSDMFVYFVYPHAASQSLSFGCRGYQKLKEIIANGS